MQHLYKLHFILIDSIFVFKKSDDGVFFASANTNSSATGPRWLSVIRKLTVFPVHFQRGPPRPSSWRRQTPQTSPLFRFWLESTLETSVWCWDPFDFLDAAVWVWAANHVSSRVDKDTTAESTSPPHTVGPVPPVRWRDTHQVKGPSALLQHSWNTSRPIKMVGWN